ncbi:hypothetical protein QDR37_00305 [Amnibacterium sp. CER49]|uniref:hypothetical protein n=1 Tax=Amnibacterium sp. CER49 TaxID=3039161 RepID=UPI00244D46FA|nr:hypothetical protein [Amnibacterium sp. CER49]MDH2442380.1 hypothetical protein [Amnibacterium sp. CER49]
MSDPPPQLSRELLERGVGRVSIADAELHLVVHQLYLSLVLPGGYAAYVAPDELGRLIEGCRTMLEVVRLSTEVWEAVKSALAFAATAHRRRNSIIHNAWWPTEGQGGWTGMIVPWAKAAVGRATNPVLRPGDLEAACEQLIDAKYRIQAVWWLWLDTSPDAGGSGHRRRPEKHEGWLRIMQGHYREANGFLIIDPE